MWCDGGRATDDERAAQVLECGDLAPLRSFATRRELLITA